MLKFWMATAIILMVILTLVGGLWLGAIFHVQIAVWGGTAGGGASPGGSKQLYMCGMDHHIQDHPGACDLCGMPVEAVKMGSADVGPKKDRKILYWTDEMMNPPYISDKAGKSPMGMELTPVYEDEVSAGLGVRIDPVIMQNMGLRLTKVSEGALSTTLRVVGTFTEPEQNHVEINLRVNGWIQKLYANQDGMVVAKGEKLFDLYSAELTAAADELIDARKAKDAMATETDAVVRGSAEAVVAAGKRKLSLLGLSAEEVEAIAAMDKAPATISFVSPMNGHVTEKMVVEGAAVKAGDRVMKIADRSSMWLMVKVYEGQLPLVHVGSAVLVHVNGMAEPLKGKVEFVYPHLDMMTRTATLRVVFDNHVHDIHEGMYATAEIESEVAGKTLMVPKEAVIDSGTRQIVFVAQAGGHFEPRMVTVGQTGHSDAADREDDMVQIFKGLARGDTVVTSGQFLLDSESRMQEAIQKHLRDRLATGSAATMPASTMPMTLAAPGGPEVDGVFKAYLALEGALVKADTPVDSAGLIAAAARLRGAVAKDSVRDIAGEIGVEAEEFKGLAVDKQREAFKELSVSVIHLMDQAGPSTAVASMVYEFQCPMSKAFWLQTAEVPVNPYLPDMPTCGDVARKIVGGRP